jgi:SAM-dependent methyltransferase
MVGMIEGNSILTNAKRQLSAFVDKGGILVDPDQPHQWSYNDGDATESAILASIMAASDRSCLSLDLQQRVTDWASEYHFSPRRSNLLRPLANLLNSDILEIGAGCGAITRYLGECGGRVLAVEGSMRRATIARARTQDLDNVTVACGNALEIDFGRKFDVVTLIGVLEYARVFNAGEDPITATLRFARSLLKDGGVLILAIENQLGLKYFSGALEDHTGEAFFGINDKYTAQSVVTFGRQELRSLIHGSGFATSSWYFPFPDYKMPTCVLAESATDRETASRLADLFGPSDLSDPQRPAEQAFSLDRAWPVMARNGLVPDVANSFLVVCQASAKSGTPDPRDLAWHYSTERHPAFAKQALFQRTAEGSIIVKRTRVAADAARPDVPLTLHLEDETFAQGGLWSAQLGKILNQKGWTARQVADWLRTWQDALQANAGSGALVPGRFLDALPFNLSVGAGGGSQFIDQEWEYAQEVPVAYLAYRGLIGSLWRIASCEQPRDRKHRSMARLITDVLQLLGHSVSARDLVQWRQQDLILQRAVRFGTLDLAPRGAAKILALRMPVRRHRAKPMVQRIKRRLRSSLHRLTSRRN